MYKIKNLYEQITPKTDPADLAEKIIRGECSEKSSVKKHGKRFIGIASALCALAMTTFTVGAVSGWDFKAFFINMFGGSTENMREYIVDGGKVEIAAETFDKFDFTVTGLAVDENMAYLGLDIISLDGETLLDDTRLDIGYGDEGCSQSSVDCIENSDGRYSCLVTLFGNSRIKSTHKGTINISRIYIPDPAADGNMNVYDSGILRINFEIENTLPEKKIETPFELEIPALFYKTNNSYNDTVTEGVMHYTINRLSLSGMALVLDYEKPHDNAPQGFFEENKIYLLLNDGSRVTVKSIGAYGSSSSEDEINFTPETGKIMFLIPEPVDVNNVSAIVFGDTVIYC